MPRSKYIKPPGPHPRLDGIRRANFRFSDEHRKELVERLPRRFHELGAPNEYRSLLDGTEPTLADLIIKFVEDDIVSHLTATSATSGGAPLTPARARAAIRRLREALKPFREGWLDTETCDLIPPDLDACLEQRERELEAMPALPAERRERGVLCERLGIILKRFAEANNVRLERSWALGFIACALDSAGIPHPDPSEHSQRLAALVFPER